ncbi:hypothetical protein XF24_00647 [candidate division SR1 bacterium Aalborg_AAW-1]|nr:hypothetical protein XF24_00647 [candidate division SR1 bacterium Aalborg_AAW-1]
MNKQLNNEDIQYLIEFFKKEELKLIGIKLQTNEHVTIYKMETQIEVLLILKLTEPEKTQARQRIDYEKEIKNKFQYINQVIFSL